MSHSSSHKVILAALVGNTLIALIKFAAASFTHSSAMLVEGVHSLVDTGNQVLLLYGLKRAKKPADEQYPFGHGKEIYFWSFIVAILIFALGAGISIYEGVQHILHPHPSKSPVVNYVVLGLAILFEGGAWYYAFKEFNASRGRLGWVQAVRRGKDPTLFVVLFEDTAALLGLFTALAGVMLGQITSQPFWDGLASILIGCILGATAFWLAHETQGLLIGESAGADVNAGIRSILGKFSEIKKVNEILTLHMGPDFILANISIDIADSMDVCSLKRVTASLDEAIKAQFSFIKRIFIEVENKF